MFYYIKYFEWFPFIIALGSCATCIPPQSNFYWKTPCDKQTFQNSIIVTDLIATQNGKSLDSQGGIDATVDLVGNLTITDNYKQTVQNPLIDLSFQEYTNGITGCKWIQIPTGPISQNKNACDIFSNCHMNDPANPTDMTVRINIADIAGPYIGSLSVGVYYGVSLTYKEGTTGKLMCFYIQDKIIKL